MISKKIPFLLIIILLLSLSACSQGRSPTAVTGGTTATGAATLTATVLNPTATTVPTPSATPEPQALLVGDASVSVAEYQAEQAQLQSALQTLGKTLPPEQQRQQVLDNLTDTLLLAQGAQENGFKLDDATLQAEIDRLTQSLGGAPGLQAWISAHGYVEASFRAALARNLAAAWQRDQIANSVPTEAEQVHARQILTQDENIANKALQYVKIPGTNFAAYAYNYDPQTGGDLGWFPRGYLTQPEVEAAAFQLQPGEISPVIKSAVGYHILQVIAREPARVISPDARRVLQHQALQDWLKAKREASKIQVLLP